MIGLGLGFRIGLLGGTGGNTLGPLNWSGAVSTAWVSAGNWVGGTAPANDTTSNAAVFNAASYTFQPNAGTASISGITVGVSSAALTLSGTSLTLGSGGVAVNSVAAIAISSPLVFTSNSTFSAAGGALLTASGVISGAFKLTKTGAGSIALKAANTYSGGTDITAGRVSPVNAAAFGTGLVTCSNGVQVGMDPAGGGGNFTLANSFALTSGIISFLVPFSNGTDLSVSGVLSGSGGLLVVTLNGAGRRFGLLGANTFSGGITIGSASDDVRLAVGTSTSLGTGTLVVDQTGSSGLENTSTVVLANSIVINSGRVFNIGYNSSASLTLSGVVSGAGSLNKGGTGPLLMNAANTFSGGSTVASGTLRGTGTIGATSVASGGSIAGGTGAGNAGTLSTGALTLSTGGALTVNISGGTSTSLVASSGALVLNSNAVTFEPVALAVGTYTLFTCTSQSGTLAAPTLTGTGRTFTTYTYSSTSVTVTLA